MENDIESILTKWMMYFIYICSDSKACTGFLWVNPRLHFSQQKYEKPLVRQNFFYRKSGKYFIYEHTLR